MNESQTAIFNSKFLLVLLFNIQSNILLSFTFESISENVLKRDKIWQNLLKSQNSKKFFSLISIYFNWEFLVSIYSKRLSF